VDEMDQNIQRAREAAQEAVLKIIDQFEDYSSPTEEGMLNLLLMSHEIGCDEADIPKLMSGQVQCEIVSASYIWHSVTSFSALKKWHGPTSIFTTGI
jgi:hypothetical protein